MRDPADDVLRRAVALRRCAAGLWSQQRRVEAESAARQSLALMETHAGVEAPEVATVIILLASVRAFAGDLVEAEALCRRAVRIMTAHPPGERAADRLCVHSLATLALVTRRLGQYDDAEAQLLCALTIARRRLGARDRHTLAIVNELGIVYQGARRFDEAEACFCAVLAVLDTVDASSASVFDNLAGLEHARGRLVAAERWARRSVELRTAALGADDMETILSVGQLGAIVADQGRHAEGEAMLRAVVDRLERALGPAHYAVAVTAGNLATLLSERGDVIEAEALYRRALRIKTAVLGPGHAEVAALANNLAVLLAGSGRVAEAVHLLRPAVAVLRARLGMDDPTTQVSTANLAALVSQRTASEMAVAGP